MNLLKLVIIMENDELKEIEGMEELYTVNKAKIYKEIQALEKGYLIKNDKGIDVIGG